MYVSLRIHLLKITFAKSLFKTIAGVKYKITSCFFGYIFYHKSGGEPTLLVATPALNQVKMSHQCCSVGGGQTKTII